MCGRFTLSTPLAILQGAFPWLQVPDQFPLRYNIAPSTDAPVIRNDGKNRLEFFKWGLIPSWAKDSAIGNRMINARCETLAEKPSFRAAYAARRCLVLADGFYEWRKQAGTRTKTPYYIRLKSGRPFAFAGLWETWRPPDAEPVRSFTIVTTDANEILEPIHHRMPVILSPRNHEAWLAPEKLPPETLDPLLAPFPSAQMEAYPISTYVNSPRNDGPQCVAPLQEAGQGELWDG